MQSRLEKSVAIVLAITVLLQIVAIFTSSVTGVDAPSQLSLESQFTQLVRSATLIPRWVPTGFYGFGAPSFYFYPPLAFYTSSIASVLTGQTDAVWLFKAVGLLATIGS